MHRPIRTVTKIVVFAIVAPIGVLLGSIFAFGYHTLHPIKSFCNEVTSADTAQTLIDRALTQKLFYTRWQGKEDIWVLNRPLEEPFMFRVACAVTFKDGKVSGKTLIDAD